ncbi:asparagine synthase (glutamine-hydrolyzing) [Rhizorhabdus histidinilytica]|uniref:asparagine synthase (glutamine-hydrolyzing) n=1 Tax=Rhizorhabdus histidinilytica TaxID=439228 RepID=UPI0032203E7F
MCGIAGFWRPSGLSANADRLLASMTDAITHRGPDSRGSWYDNDAGIVMGHRRLAIIDLSSTGAQPMLSADGRWVICLNGEIYNFRELRSELEAQGVAPDWRGHSDTEVLLAAIAAWGINKALEVAIGMFAFALWDRRERCLTLARDRMGEKPLYYGWQGVGAERTLLFASELSAIRRHEAFRGEIDPDALALMTRYLYVPEPWSIYRGIAKLMPGTRVELHADGSASEQVYWDSLREYARAALDTGPLCGLSTGEAAEELERLLSVTIKRQMVADVPVGTFLSGGIDSSVVTALMQAQSAIPVKSFSIGFDDPAYDESHFARKVAEHLGTEHRQLVVGVDAALDIIARLPDFYSEPFADSSQIPTMLVARMARDHVTVALSGDAGDELFGGYNRHVHGLRTWPRLAKIPVPLRKTAARALMAVSPESWDKWLGSALSGRMRNIGDKLHKAAGVLAAGSSDDLYRGLISINRDANRLLLQPAGSDGFEQRSLEAIASLHPVDRMMALDAVHYLPGDILAKVDRAAMAASLETRVPMLDPDVVRFAWGLPLDMKIRDGTSKWILRDILYRHVPRELVDRPKAGFGIPLGSWLRGPLRDWAQSLIDSTAAPIGDHYHLPEVRKLWEQHLSGKRNNQHQLWPILMFQGWRLHQGFSA